MPMKTTSELKNNCAALHAWARSLPRHTFPFDEAGIPKDGLYLLFEEGEQAHGGPRVVRVGTHTGNGQLLSRLRQHFVMANKDRSIFRKNIGRALLKRSKDRYADVWELDMTTAAARKKDGNKIDADKQHKIEQEVTAYMQKAFSFAVVPIPELLRRLQMESKIISTLSLCEACEPSATWLGRSSPKLKIRESGLWLVNELYKTPLTEADLLYLEQRTI